MTSLFGVSMTAIMIVLVALFAFCALVLAGIYAANRTMFRMGTRNVSRRRTQSILVVCGLMLATVIITAAFGTGDSIDYSATRASYDNLQRTDLSLHHFRSTAGESAFDDYYVSEDLTAALEAHFAGDPDVEGFMPFLYASVAILDLRTSLAEPVAVLTGYDAGRLERFGGLRLVGGGPADLAGLAPGEALLGERIADRIDARVGDTVQVFSDGQPADLVVAGIVRDERASGWLEFGPGTTLSGIAVHLDTAQRITGHEGEITTINVALRGGVRGSLGRSDPAAARLEALEDDEAAKATLGLGGIAFQVEQIKSDAVEGSRLAANVFTTIFLVLGLFSIAAGAMLIFTLFVMLAAERRTEMGIARAVGTQRSQLVQSFIAEGAVYDILAGLAGVVLGVGAAYALVAGARVLVGEVLDVMTPHVTPRSLVVSFCLGVVLTFMTVAFSSLRISQLNIVAAVRGEIGNGPREARHRTHWAWVIAGVPALILPPLGLYLVLRRGFGMPWAWIVGPVGVLGGATLTVAGGLAHLAFPYTLGVSLVILSAAAVAAYYGVGRRAAWSAAGLGLAIFWLVPNDLAERVFGDFETTGMEMFVLSGIMVVAGFTLIIVFNARLLADLFITRRKGARRYTAPVALGLLALASAAIGVLAPGVAGGLGQLALLLAVFFAMFGALSLASVRFAQFAPAFRMAVAYPLTNRFRTGMTIAMFSIVVFSITVMGIINGSFLAMFATDEADGGWDVLVAANGASPVEDLRAALAAEGFDASRIAAAGGVTRFDDNAQEVRRPGGEWVAYPILAGDDEFFREAQMALMARATGYVSDRAVFDAVASTPGLAILDSAPLQDAFGAAMLRTKVTVEDGAFEPFALELRDPVTGASATVTVVGVLSAKIPGNLMMGVYTNAATYRPVLGAPEYGNRYVRLAEGNDGASSAKEIEAALVTRGVQALSIEEEIEGAVARSMGFLRVFQAFMAMGLVVGIASLGVVALRSVVERRQQIGMLRAIGYQRTTVALSFILESGFIAMLGILAGVVGATLLCWRLIEGGEFPGSSELGFFIPWMEIGVESALALVCALLMTWLPSRRAAAVPIAEALRYE